MLLRLTGRGNFLSSGHNIGAIEQDVLATYGTHCRQLCLLASGKLA